MDFYTPEEDTFFLLEKVSDFLKKQDKKNLDIFEIGLGSGEISFELKKKFLDNHFFGSDTNKKAIINTRKIFKENDLKIKCENCSFFDKFQSQEFDLIFFNAPYLPIEKNEDFNNLSNYEKSLYGGEKGFEIIFDFLEKSKIHLRKNGKIFVLFSNLTNKNEIEIFLEKGTFIIEKKFEKKIEFFEKLFVYQISLQT